MMYKDDLKLYFDIKLIDFQYDIIGKIRNRISILLISVQTITLVVNIILKFMFHSSVAVYTSMIIIWLMFALNLITCFMCNRVQKYATSERKRIENILEVLLDENEAI